MHFFFLSSLTLQTPLTTGDTYIIFCFILLFNERSNVRTVFRHSEAFVVLGRVFLVFLVLVRLSPSGEGGFAIDTLLDLPDWLTFLEMLLDHQVSPR